MDTETISHQLAETKVQAKLRFGYACFVRRHQTKHKEHQSEEWIYFTSSSEFWEWVDTKVNKRTKVYLFCHNASFDFQVVEGFYQSKALGYEVIDYVIEYAPFWITLRKDTKTIVFISTTNYFAMSLKILGDAIGIKKLEMPSESASQEEWEIYGKNDVVIIKEAVLTYVDFVKEHNFGNFQKTLASQSFTAYRHRFMMKPIYIHDDQEALEAERESYYGGRTECFRLGEYQAPFHLYDVNSMYPAVMQANEYPTELKGKLRNVHLHMVIEMLDAFAVIAKVNLDTDEPAYAVRREGKLVFPVGKFTAHLTSPEVKYAYEQGHIRSIPECWIYKKAPIFTEYVTELYDLRQQYAKSGNEAFRFMVKIFMNSLYGKFGQRGIRWETLDRTDDTEIKEWIEINVDTKEHHKFRTAMGLVQEQSREAESHNSFPAIAAHVTGYARILLWQYIKAAGRENVYYCDTDSLLVTEEGSSRLSNQIDKNTLGKLKHEASYSKVAIRGPKDYTFDKKVKIKGIRANAEEIRPGVYRQAKFWGMRTAWQKGLYDAQIIESITKTLVRQYTKGQVKDDGVIEPFDLTAAD